MCTFTYFTYVLVQRAWAVAPVNWSLSTNHWQTLCSPFFSENMDLHVFSARNTVRGTGTAYQQNDRFYFEAGWSICLQRWHITRKACSLSISFILGWLERWIEEKWGSAPSMADKIFETFFASWMCCKLKGADSRFPRFRSGSHKTLIYVLKGSPLYPQILW